MGEIKVSQGPPGILEPLGDQGVLVHLASEELARGFAEAVKTAGLPWVVEVLVAYRCVAVFYDLELTDYATVTQQLSTLPFCGYTEPGRLVYVPCCYELGPDLLEVASLCRCRVEEVIALHSGQVYTIYAIGFVPGFPYLGYLLERLAGVPRLEQPRRQVDAGSVGIAGKQTGIYPSAVPGGWRIIGRTPLVIADLEREYFPLRIGDRLQFVPIGRSEFERLRGHRLEDSYSANKAST
ncbi:Kinase A inhibitor [bacterium HR36]|nr:Kinase A inhibitor [bacterium HR36]